MNNRTRFYDLLIRLHNKGQDDSILKNYANRAPWHAVETYHLDRLEKKVKEMESAG